MRPRFSRRAPSPGRIGLGLFALLFAFYAYFHQGGGWNQNARFAQVRAIVEQGVLQVNDFLLFVPELADDGTLQHRRVRLSDPTTRARRLPRANTLDLSVQDGRYYPNKPPGVALLAVPAYALLYGAERTLGADPDDWWVMTLNLYLITVFSVGLIGALGGVVFFGVSRRLFPQLPTRVHLASTLAFGLGTLMLPYSTMLMDHVPVATGSLLTFRLVLEARDRRDPRGAWLPLFGAGSAAGLCVLLNNSALLMSLAVGAYALARVRPRLPVLAYAAGGIVPALALTAYQWTCFGDPFAIPQARQLVIFQTEAPLLGVFAAPNWSVLPELLVRPYRGLFFASPVLLVGLLALLAALRRPETRGEAILFAALALGFIFLNLCFNGWHGGSTFGPRYLTAAVPFLALPLAPALSRFPRAVGAVAALSASIALGVTSIDPQVDFLVRRPYRDYYLPLARGEAVVINEHEIRGPVSARPYGPAGDSFDLFTPETRGARWNSFNAGEALFPASWASLLPLIAVAAALGARLFRRAGFGESGTASAGDPR